MWKKILLGVVLALVLVVGGFAAAVALQPNEYAVERSTVIAAPPAAVFAQLNDFQKWNDWSPWVDLDPHAKTTMSTPSSGKGAVFGWDGNDQVGEGTLTIVESKPDELVEAEQTFVRPMEGTALLRFTLTPDGAGTKLTWRMEGKNNFICKAMCMFVDMEQFLGEKFDEGLASIKQTAEAQSTSPALVPESEVEDAEAT